MGMGCRQLRVDVALLDQFFQQCRPLGLEYIGALETAITADQHEPIDIVEDQILGGFAASLTRAELGGPRRSNDRTTLMEDPTESQAILRILSPPSIMPR